MCYYLGTPKILGTKEREERVNVKLQLARKKAGKTQERVAKEAGIIVAQYQNVEYDKSTPNVRTAIRIADSLGVVDLRELFEGGGL